MTRALSAALIALLSCTFWITDATAQDHVWSRLYTDLQAGSMLPPPNPWGLEELKRASGAVDFAGNLIVFGKFRGTLDFGGDALTPGNAFLAKLDPSSAHVWSKRFVGTFYGHQKTQVACDPSGNVLITEQILGTVDFGDGPLSGETVLVKFDPNGNHLWGRGFDTNVQDPYPVGSYGVATDSDGNVFLVGGYRGALDFGNGALPIFGGVDIFVAKFDPDGNTLWSRGFGTDPDNDIAFQVACDAAGDVIITGLSEGQGLNLGGGPMSVPSPSWGLTFAAKFSGTNCSHLWSHGFRKRLLGVRAWTDVATNTQSEAFLTGSYRDSIDLGGGSLISVGTSSFIAKFDISGAHVWSHNYPGSSSNAGIEMSGIKTDPAGNIHVVGTFGGTLDLGGNPISSSTGSDVLAASFDPLGQHRWSHGYGEALGPNVSRVEGMVDDEGNALMVVEWDGSIDFGGDSFSSPYNLELYVVKLGAAPTDVIGPGASVEGLRAYPNPSRGSMVLWVSAAAPRAIALRILDPRGRVVRTLATTRSTAESRYFDWDGRDDAGRSVGAGVYFATTVSSGASETRKLLVVR